MLQLPALDHLIFQVDDRDRTQGNLTEDHNLLILGCMSARLGKHLVRDAIIFIPSLTCERACQMHDKGKMGTRARAHTHTHTHTHWKNSKADADQCDPKQELNAIQCDPSKPMQINANQCESNANTTNKSKQIKP